MQDRETIKWAPFNSLINGYYLIKSIEYEKNKIPKPILSEEQINIIEQKIIEAYIDQTKLELKIYKNGYIYNTYGLITKINSINKKIILNNKKVIYFFEILDITLIYN